jgi:hypothetical protein
VAFLEMGKKQDVVLQKAVARNKKKNGFLYETFEKWDQQTKIVSPNVKWLNYIKYLP